MPVSKISCSTLISINSGASAWIGASVVIGPRSSIGSLITGKISFWILIVEFLSYVPFLLFFDHLIMIMNFKLPNCIGIMINYMQINRKLV
ncbi:hypothetical protein BpHYR1_040990 [Brachionus plicatilis]|uniref:Uncharacterized protein n=1 Tax=Brachionus plicatilis TaxID=10195 RepID=A0A3M7QQ48_BRAPC|nr:hypothetical protein BpHYR1_040990 [Brachionus plicatilis]